MADPGFSGTVVGGIQDISALLPLLGTEQCEKHVGSALEKGFLYSSVTPISIFGSLGIVRAGFNILVASISIRRFKFLGAQKLKNGGFEPKGDLAPMIAFDQNHPRRFLAESRLDTMLAQEHIPNPESLTVSWGAGIIWWNFYVFVLSLTFSLFGLLPYIAILRGSDHPKSAPFIPSGWGFPILRVLGCAFCVSIPQYLIQLRILVILKARLLFMTIDQYALGDPFTTTILGFKKKHADLWNTDLPSETCIWELERWFNSSSNHKERNPDAQPGVEACSADRDFAPKIYESKFTRHLGFMRHPFLATFHIILSFFLIISILATIVGYIGCFYLIQKASNNSKGPLVWLGLEILLSIVRILVWAYNPLWDDSNGVLFKLKLSPQLPPLITCTKSHREILKDGLIPVTRGDDFIKDLVSHKGPFPLVKWDNIELYYVLKADDTNLLRTLDLGKDIPGILYIIVHNYKEQSSRLISRDHETGRFSIHICTLKFGNRNTIDVKVDFGRDATDKETHSFTADEKAMGGLELHYDNIMSLLSDPTIKNDKFGKTWAMRRPIQDCVRHSQLSLIPAKILKQLYQTCVDVISRSSSTFKDPDIELGRVDEEQARVLVYEAEMKHSLLDWDVFGSEYESEWEEYDESRDTKEEECGDSQDTEEEDQGSVNGEEGEEYDHSQDTEEKEQDNNHQRETTRKKPRYLLTSLDKALLQHGYSENRCLIFCLRIEKWVEDYMELYQSELRNRPPIPAELEDKVNGWIRDANTREVDLVLTHCLSYMEYFFSKIRKQLSKDSRKRYNTMVENISVDTFGRAPLEAEEKHKKDKLMARLKSAQDLQSQLLRRKYLDRKRNRWMGWGKPDATIGELDRPWDEIEAILKKAMSWRLVWDRNRNQEIQPGSATNDDEPAIATKDDDKTFRQFTNHCQERIEELIYRLNSQQQELNDVSKEMISIINDPATMAADSTNLELERAYWTKESLDERLRMLRHKNLHFEHTSNYALGGPQNLARALRRSRPFAFIDFDSVEEQLTAHGILSVVQDLKSVTGVFYRKEFLETDRKMIADALTSKVQKMLAENLDACSFTGFQLFGGTDRAQYTLVSDRVHPSTCTITFHTQVPEQDHILAVRHWCIKHPEEVHFNLNGRDIDFSLRATDDFVYQDILLLAPRLCNGKNTFTISFPPPLALWTPPRYHLADIWLPVPVTGQPDSDSDIEFEIESVASGLSS